MKGNPSIKAALVALQEAEAKKKVTEAELKPTYRIGLDATRSQNVIDGGGATSFSSSIGVSLPLYGGRQISKSKIRQDEIAVHRLRQQLASAQALVEQEVVQAWNQFQTAQAVGAARAAQIQAAELSLRGSEAEVGAGTKTNNDVIASQQSLTSAQVSANNARVDVVQGAYNLVAAMGRLSARDLALPVRYYEPEREFENRRIENLATLLYDR
jgi:outer membrane protein